ncbi:MAG TPA: DNA polymerase III subunit gamma/tau C-terminal domain-containing protein, partial [Methylophilus sp.]|nr:DNA polymerase III subunit gamma/tau C-terminal domain-containing protein [Methylophilus sp.]
DILGQEQITFEAPALQLIARAANGSMRDALSLTDQAIAYGNQSVRETDVRSMLGAIDQSYLYELLRALINNDALALLDIAKQMDSRSIGFESALKDLAALLHLLAIAQHSPQAIADDHPERQTLLDLSSQLTAEMLQLYYQISILGHRDIGLAPDAYAGFTMTLLRMLAFKTDAMTPASTAPASSAPAGNTGSSENNTRSAAASGGARAALAQSRQPAVTNPVPAAQAPVIVAPAIAVETTISVTQAVVTNPPVIEDVPVTEQAFAQAVEQSATSPEILPFQWDGNWRTLVENHLSKLGLVRALAQNCELVSYDADNMVLRIGDAHKHLASTNYLDKLNSALNSHFGRRIKLTIQVGQEANTPARQLAVERAELQDQAKDAILSDHFVQGLMQEMGATIVPNSIKPLH